MTWGLRTTTVALGLALIPVLAACGDASERDLCIQYKDVVATAQDVRNLNPATASADEIRAKLTEFRIQLDELQAVSEGRVDLAISDLRGAIAGLRQAASEADAGSLAAARPLLEDSLEDVKSAWARLREVLQPECPGG